MMMMGSLLLLLPASAQACTPSAGTYCPSPTGAAVDCPTGYYCTGDAVNDHTACPAGTYNSLTGQSSSGACAACSTGTVALTTGQSQCVACAAGSVYADAHTCNACAAGTYAASGDATCTACASGHYSVVGSGACLLCKPGTYQPAGGAAGCVACGVGTYTYTSSTSGGVTSYTAVWGATAASQCVATPAQTSQTLVCLPGYYISKATCAACPVGYYCPEFTVYQFSNPRGTGVVRICPVGKSTAVTGAMASSDCTANTALLPYTLAQCGVTPSDVAALSSFTIKAMATSLDTSIIYFATATAVYRLFLQSNTLELLAGAEGVVSHTFADAVGTDARFGGITSIAVDRDLDEATVLVVGDLTAVRLIDVYTRTVKLMDSVGSVGSAGGIALVKTGGVRWAYVSDTVNNRIMAFSVDQPTQSCQLVAGSAAGTAGYADSSSSGSGKTAFRSPMGLAFLDSSTLLVADSGNAVVRAITVSSRAVHTWFTPMDSVSPELVAPMGLAVASDIVYVTDSALQRASAIQVGGSPSAPIVQLTPLTLDAGSTAASFYSLVVPYGQVASTGGSRYGFGELLALDDSASSLVALVETATAQTADGGGSIATCHLPCQVAGCGPLTSADLCGNAFLDAGEACDDPVDGSGCYAQNCTLKPGYSCPILVPGSTTPPTTCLAPCQGYPYAPNSNQLYCTQDCSALVPPSGYTVSPQCELVDIDECVASTDTCASIGLCINTPGSYECKCLNAFFGDGYQCKDIAYAVYTVIDLPTVTQATLVGAPSAAISALLASYASILSAAVPGSFSSTALTHETPAQLAARYATYSLDPAFAGASHARLELVTLFETNALANTIASSITADTLALALSEAFFSASTGVVVTQAPKVRQHEGTSFLGPTIIGGWGMNITGVTYNETCTVQTPLNGFTIPPQGGCWQVEMLYVGGQALPEGDEKQLSVQQSKNVLYLPRIENNPDTLKPITPAQTLTMSSGASFACDSATDAQTGQVASSATVCCLRAFEASYRPSYGFSGFVTSAGFAASAPTGVCSSGKGINGTFPPSDLVYDLAGDGTPNDLVVGYIEGMPSSEVRLLETLDYTTRTQRVLLVLEEGDLRKHATQASGVTGVSYTMSFFVGLANFAGTGTSALTTRNTQQRITVTKVSTLTVSTFGTNQDPLLTSETMSLMRITVTDFFNPVQYLYYLQVQLTFPVNFQPPVDSPIIPLDGIRLIKVSGGQTATANSADWIQVCANPSGSYVYSDAALQALVLRAQAQSCVQINLAMCEPPTVSQGLVSFGIPLPIGFITDADFAGGAVGNPTSLQIQMVVQSLDNVARTNVLSSVSMAVQLTSKIAVNMMCVSLTADHTLMDVIDGSIYIGMPTNNLEWNTAMQKQSHIQVPGSSSPANSLEFQTVTVQSSLMTFSALGNASYFEDYRYQGQSVNMSDIFTIHFLEPIGSDPNGPTPHFDAVKTLFFAGGAFNPIVDPVTHNTWLVPSAALLNICPLRPTIGKLACMTRIDSTYAGNRVTRSVNDVVEIRVGDASSVAEVQALVGQVIYAGVGASTSYSNQKGADFYNELVAQLGLNNRYRKAYVVNPVTSWSLDAMQATQPSANAYTVATKIIGIGLITLQSASGQQLSRRLLTADVWESSSGKVIDSWTTTPPSSSSFTTPSPSSSPLDEETLVAGEPLPMAAVPSFSLEEEDSSNEGLAIMPVVQQPVGEWNDQPTQEEAVGGGGRRLLSTTAAASLSPTKTQSGNSLMLDINAPGFDPVTQFCGMTGKEVSSCRMLQYAAQVSNAANANALCAAQDQGTLSTILHEGFANSLKPAPGYASNITTTLLASYHIEGCPSSSSSGRRLLQQSTVVVVVSNVLVTLTSDTTYAIVNPDRLALIQYFQNATIMRQLLGGNAVIREKDAPIPTGLVNGSSFYENYTFYFANLTSVPANLTDLFARGGEPAVPPGVKVSITDVPFVTDGTVPPPPPPADTTVVDKKSGSVRDAALSMGINTLLAVSLLLVGMQGSLPL